ncbi:MAG TPA: glycosyltransferase family protein [Cytophagales bacterium]|nr:glycosyltransferase family protein [Cytophagales bacterium]
MKILYAIQGTGNGHLSRARDIIPILQKKGELDLLVSGIQADVTLPYPVKYKFGGLSFIFGKKGGVDLKETFKRSDFSQLISEIKQVPVEEYDLVINDFEPVTAWACLLKRKECISLSHQAAVLHKHAPKPKQYDLFGKTILKNYAPVTAKYGFHFQEYGKNIFTPVIRKEIRDIKPENHGHYTVYLPAYSDKKIIKILSEFKDIQWWVFSKHNKEVYVEDNIMICPINNETFIKSMATAEGILCGAGFETPAEALFLNKKLLVIPMKNQFEQQCNAAALKTMGIPVIKSLKKKHIPIIEEWIKSEDRIEVNYPDTTEKIIDTIFELHSPLLNKQPPLEKTDIRPLWKLKEIF